MSSLGSTWAQVEINFPVGCSCSCCFLTICIRAFGIYNATVFQAEVKAVQKAAILLHTQGFRYETITIHSDSQACLAALDSNTVKTSLQLVQDCI
jgi:hypothetical protein